MKILEGTVVSVKMTNTVLVEITTRTPHPLYKKLIKRSRKFKVDNKEFDVNVGDRVRIIETKPISKEKYFKVLEKIEVGGTKKTKNIKTTIKTNKKEEVRN